MQGTSDPNAELFDAYSLCRHLIPGDSVHAFLADHRRELFPDDLFADLFPSGRGRPSVPADVIATVMVLQSLEGLSDREAAGALRRDVAWKAACGLSVTDEGFHPTVLTYWRARLRRSQRPQRVFDAVRTVIEGTGVLKGRKRRALDSTVLDDAVATQDTVTQLVAAIRRVRRLLPEAASVAVSAHDYDQPGKPACAWDDAEARDQLVTALVRDALAIIEALPDEVPEGEAADAVALLALVAGQDVEEGEEPGTWRIATSVAPERIVSTVDPESRHVHKTNHEYRNGFKAHLGVEPETGLITAAVLTAGNVHDSVLATELVATEAQPVDVLADSAYGSGEARARLRAAGHRQWIKPAPLRPAVPGGFTKDDFAIDFSAGTVSCPNGVTTHITRTGRAVFGARCRGCRLRSRCTTARHGKCLNVHPHEAELIAARQTASDPAFQREYQRWRPMVERTIAWLVAKGHRRVPYRGIERNALGLSIRAATVNLRRLVSLGVDRIDGTWVLTA